MAIQSDTMYHVSLYRNGPTGSAVCVFTFDEQANDIGRVFDGDYLQLVSEQWVTVNNYQPFTVSFAIVLL